MRNVVATAAVLLFAGAAAAFVAAAGQDRPQLPGRQTVPAPIDELDVRVAESMPPRYFLHLVAGLPSGCAEPARHDVSRQGDSITVTVLNSMPSGDVMCTMIYGTYELNIDLGTDLSSGRTYTVRVNDRTTTFTAQ